MAIAMVQLDFIVIGVQKSATTWLYKCLKDHPQIAVKSNKQEHIYIGGDLFHVHGEEWFSSFFPNAQPAQIVGDVSVNYLATPRAVQAVYSYFPDIKCIVSLRDPIERLISAYFWKIHKQTLPEIPLETLLNQWLNRCYNNYEVATITHIESLIEWGFYDTQLKRFLEKFAPEQFLIVLYDEIIRDPISVLRKIYSFLVVEETFLPRSLNTRPQYVKSKPSAPFLTKKMYSRLADIYAPHIKNLQNVIRRIPQNQQPAMEFSNVWLKGEPG